MKQKIIFSFCFLMILIFSIFVSAQETYAKAVEELKISWFEKFIASFGIGSYAEFRLAIEKEDPSYCINISSNYWQAECLDETIRFNKDPKLCDKIAEENIEANFAKDECYMDVAIMKNDISYCNLVGNNKKRCGEISKYYTKETGINEEKEFNECINHINNTKNRCKIRFASETENIGICSNLLELPQSLSDIVHHDEKHCEDSIAMKTKNISLCRTSSCIIEVLKGTLNYVDCSKILGSEIIISRWASGDLTKDVQYDICLFESENPQACFNTHGEDTSCFWNAATKTNNASWCSFITPFDPKDFGSKICAGHPDDPSTTCEYTEGYLNKNDLLRVQCYSQMNQCEKATEISQRLGNHCYYISDSYGHFTGGEKEKFCSNIVLEGKSNPSCKDYEEHMQQFGIGIKPSE